MAEGQVSTRDKRRKWLIGIGAVAGDVLVALTVAGYVLANRLEPYVRTQVILYLENRFDSEVELAVLRVRLPRLSPVQVLLTVAAAASPRRSKGTASCCATRAVETRPPIVLDEEGRISTSIAGSTL
jgi:hypothetical protein